MREEVLVLPPAAERRKAGFCLSKTDEAAFNISRKCVAPEATYVKRSSHVAGVRRDLKSEEEHNGLQSVLTEKMQTEALRREGHTIAPAAESGKHEINEEGRRKQLMRSSSAHQTQKELLQDALPLQWGIRKGSRSSRRPKPFNLVDESKTVRVEAVQDSSVPTNSNAVAMEDCSKSKTAVSRKRDHPCSPPAEHADLEREKRLRSTDLSKGKRGVSVQGGKREEHQCITRSSPGKRLESPDQATLTNGIGAGPGRKDFSLPKFVITLSRKEMEEDFLIFKGNKLPKRPKRRPKVAERAVLYCTPGIGLSDVSISRYTVKEKKAVKGKSRGLKAMESEETDSD